MARPVYYETALKKSVYLYSRLPRYCKPRRFKRMQVSVYTRYWFKIALEHSARVGLSEYVFQNAKNMVSSRGSGVNIELANLNMHACRKQ